MDKLSFYNLASAAVAGLGFGTTMPLLWAAAEGLIVSYWRAWAITACVWILAFSSMASRLSFDDAAGLSMWATLTLGCFIGGILDNIIAYYLTNRA